MGGNGTCVSCPDDVKCDEDGATLVAVDLKKDAWRLINTSNNIYDCPVKGTCLGGNDTDRYVIHYELIYIRTIGVLDGTEVSVCLKVPASLICYADTHTHTHTHRISHSYAVTAKKVILEYCVPFARPDGIAAALTTRVPNAPRK
jgi:hypothetical protein